MSGALVGLRVIDCSRLIAGGVLATILADHGADVIKVENPRGGDPLRAHGSETVASSGGKCTRAENARSR